MSLVALAIRSFFYSLLLIIIQMPNILTYTDGSIYASSVYQHAAWAATKLSASVHVLHMLDPHHEDPLKVDHSGSIGINAKNSLMQEIVELEANRAKIARKHGEIILDHALAELNAAGVQAVDAAQRHGRLTDSIDQYERDADLVVIGKRGHSCGLEDDHIGHNLERVIRGCQHPVLVASRQFMQMDRFVLAFDGGSSAQKAVEYAATNPLLKGMQGYLIGIGSDNSTLETPLIRAQQTLSNAGYDVSAEMRNGEPDQVINQFITQAQINLLIMGAYGHSRIRHLIIGSTTTTMIRTVKIPVLLFR